MANQTNNKDDIYLAKYNAALGIHNSECQIQWSRFNALLVANTVFIALIGLSINNEGIPASLRFPYRFIPLLGLIICFWWWKTTMKGFVWIHFWIKQAREIEAIISNTKDKNDPKPITAGKEFSKEHEPHLTKTASKWIICVFGIIYFVILLANFEVIK